MPRSNTKYVKGSVMGMGARGSMYTDEYLDYTTDSRVVTPGSYLSRVLRGRAREYAGRYLDVLTRDLETRVQAGEAVCVASVGGQWGYIRCSAAAAIATEEEGR